MHLTSITSILVCSLPCFWSRKSSKTKIIEEVIKVNTMKKYAMDCFLDCVHAPKGITNPRIWRTIILLHVVANKNSFLHCMDCMLDWWSN